MSISVGLADTDNGKLLRLTLSGEQRLRAEQEWGDQRIRWAIVAENSRSYRLAFYPSLTGVKSHEKMLPGSSAGKGGLVTYRCYAWSNKRLPGDLAVLREHGNEGELCIWEGGNLLVEVRKTQRPKRHRCKCSTVERRVKETVGAISRETVTITPASQEREKAMQTEAIYHLSKETNGALVYTVEEGDLSLGTLYIRKEGPLAKGKPKQIRVVVSTL